MKIIDLICFKCGVILKGAIPSKTPIIEIIQAQGWQRTSGGLVCDRCKY
jgi:hypothetical protein